MPNQMQEWLERAARKLGVKVLVGYIVKMPGGRNVTSQALFPNFGGEAGMLVFDSGDAIDGDIRRELITRGYSSSTFSAPLPNEAFDLNDYIDMFKDWGWVGGDHGKPTWMR